METPCLVPLRVPAGWSVRRNAFFEVDPRVDRGRLLNDEWFAGDLLWIARADEALSVELSWLDRDDGGAYRVVLRDAGHRIRKRLVMRDREEVRATIEHWLFWLDGWTQDRLPAL